MIFNTNFYRGLTLFFIILITCDVNAQCPTVSSTIRLCDSDTPRVSNLVATDNGGGVVWYADATGGSPLSANEILSDGTIYYADDTAGSCTNRQPQAVTLNGKPPSNVDFLVGRCSSATNTISSLNATGINIEWYTEQTGGTLLDSSTLLEDGETYWVQQTENGCVSNRLFTTVRINNPGPPTGAAEQFFCLDPTAPVVYDIGDLTAIGTNVTWYASLTSNTALDIDTPLVADATYYATQTTFPCESTSRFATIARFTTANNPGNDATLSYCDNKTATITLFDELGGTPDNGGTWTGSVATSGGSQGILDLTLLDAGDYIFTYTLPTNNSCPEESSTVMINIQREPNAGEDSNLVICSSDSSIDLFTVLGGIPDAGGTWSGPASLTNGDAGTFNPTIDLSGAYTYTVNPTAPCLVADSATVIVNLEQASNAGSDTILDICESEAPVNLLALLGGDAGGTWSPALSSGTDFFNPAVDEPGVYTYTLLATATCNASQAEVNVTVNSQLSAGMGGSISLCTNVTAVDLFTLLTDNPDTGGIWSPTLTSGTGVFDPSIDPAGNYTYTVGGTSACPSDSSIITITLNVAPNAGNDNIINFCGDSAQLDLFTLLGSADSGGTWSGPTVLANGEDGTFDSTVNTAGDYIYTVAGLGGCEDTTATISVTVTDLFPSVEVDGNEFCFLDYPTVADLITRIIPENNGTLTVYNSLTATTAVSSSDLLLDDTSYYITETDITTACEGTQRLEVLVNINNPETPVLSDTNASFCLIDSPTVNELNAFLSVGSNVIWIDVVSGIELSDSDELLSGAYYGVEEDMLGCRSMNSTTINVEVTDDLPPTLITNGNEFCGVDNPTIADLEANLTMEVGLTPVWYDARQNGSFLSNSDFLENNGIYYVANLNNVTGCESTTRTQIVIDLTICDPDVYPLLIPDGFSPNGDGVNDTFSLENVEFIYEDYTIEIYNRYGSIVYRGNNNSNPWDGSSDNGIVPNGVYFYIINYNENDIPPTQGRLYLNR